jgi:deazaflavin-dependent oxidoreductase (nitroreductase family)
MYALYRRLVTPLVILLGRQPWLPRFNKVIVSVDHWLQRVTGGRLNLPRLAGLPGLMLTVTGAKSGLPRTVPLLCVPYGEGWLIAGTNWGHPKPPAWIGNAGKAAQTGAEAVVNYEGRTVAVTPRELEGEERGVAWKTMLQTWPNYGVYQSRVERQIRVFLLTPTKESGHGPA